MRKSSVTLLQRPGFYRRMARLRRRPEGRLLVVPFDDLLIKGPIGSLTQYPAIVSSVAASPVDAILGFPWLFHRFGEELIDKAWIVNLTASTTLSQHTRKVLVGTVEEACILGADAVAVHVNFTDESEGQMLSALAEVACECRKFEMPLLALAYLRRSSQAGEDHHLELRDKDSHAYANMVSHACHAVVELGADIVKTHYTGSAESFRQVVEAVYPIPVIIAGGPETAEEEAALSATSAISAGAAGVCFGRNTHCRANPQTFLEQLDVIVSATVGGPDGQG